MKKLFGNVVATIVSVVVCLGIAELAMRAIDGLPLFAATLPPVGGTLGSDTTRVHFDRMPKPQATSWELFKSNPPPLPNRKPVPEEWLKLDAQIKREPTFGGAPDAMPFLPWDMFKAWNSAFVGDVCKHVYLKSAPGRLYIYDPPDGQPRPLFRFLPNATTPIGLVTNDYGWRGPPVPFQRSPRTIRIVFVGASTTAEIHSYGSSGPEFIGHWLNEWARARKLDVRFEVMNAGRESVGSNDIAQIVQQEVAPLRPDLVVYYEGGNQFNMKSVVKDVPTGTPQPGGLFERWMRDLSDHSALARRIESFMTIKEWPKPPYEVTWPPGLDEQNPDLGYKDLPVNLNAIMGDLDKIRAALAPVGGELAIASFHWLAKDGLELNAGRHKPILEGLNVGQWPYRYRDLERLTDFENRVFRKYAAAHGLPFIDVAGQMPFDPELFSDAFHKTPEGVRLKAWIFFLGLLPVIEANLASGAWPKPVPTDMGTTHPAFAVPPRMIPVDCRKKS